MNKAVFLDRDGTLIVDKGYCSNLKELVLMDGVVEGLRELNKAGYKLIIITNQSGIARGLYSEKDLQHFHEGFIKILSNYSVEIAAIYYCPHLQGGSVKQYDKLCNCRKPQTGLFYRAAKELDIDFSSSYAIGNEARDCAICYETQCKGFIIGSSNVESDDPRIKYCSSFRECIDKIMEMA